MSSEELHARTTIPASGQGSHALMGVVSRAATDTLTASLETMFSACDDFFFDLASRSRIPADQERHFESLREIRQQKSAVIKSTVERFAANFASIQGRTGGQPKTAQPATLHSAETMELVPHEQMEQDVIVIDMVARARMEWQQELFQLNERLLVIAPQKFEEKNSPFDPERIARCFVRACEIIDVDAATIKLLLKQFDRHVLRNLDDLYLRANQILVDARILPDLAPLRQRKVKKYELPAPAAPAAGTDQGPAAAGPGGAQGAAGTQDAGAFAGIPESEPEARELAQLLQRLRTGGIKLPMFPGLPAGGGPPIARDELVTLLSEVQLQPTTADDGRPQPLDIRHAIEAISASRGHISLGQADEDIINVVAMFFDIILDDRNLPIEIQALVSRLQIPILKVALKDRSFFTDRKNSARQLINEIARTSIGWESSSKDAQDALYECLSQLVDTILQSTSEYTEVFGKCLADLRGFIERAETRAAKVEKRTGEKVVAEAKVSKARDMVRHVMLERLEGRELPAEITAFLIDDWQQVLQLAYLKFGKDSAEWVEAVQTVDDLVWSVQAHTDEKSRARLERLLPDLEKRMAAGLEQTQSHLEDAQARLDVIREIQRKLVASDSTAIRLQPLTPVQQEKITPSADPEQKSWKEMTAVERQKVQYEALMFEYLKRVDELPSGTWFLYDDLRRGNTRRCKLSARIAETQSFVFVNRFGVQVYEKPRKAFAYDLQMGHARVIEDTPLFERTLKHISSNLRKFVGES